MPHIMPERAHFVGRRRRPRGAPASPVGWWCGGGDEFAFAVRQEGAVGPAFVGLEVVAGRALEHAGAVAGGVVGGPAVAEMVDFEVAGVAAAVDVALIA